MVAQSGTRVKVRDPVAWVRYDDGLTQEFPLDRLRLADFRHSVPWRKVRSRQGQAHYPGSYASATTGGFVIYESRLELARLQLADFDPQVEQIYAQPFRLAARAGGRVRHHVPDFLLVSGEGTARLVNVKPAARLLDPQVTEALAWPGVLARRLGWEYEVWSGEGGRARDRGEHGAPLGDAGPGRPGRAGGRAPGPPGAGPGRPALAGRRPAGDRPARAEEPPGPPPDTGRDRAAARGAARGCGGSGAVAVDGV
jgi:hypothetical protein